MKFPVWCYEALSSYRAPVPRPSRRKTVSQILKAAYRKHVRDNHTKLAVKRCLR